ncbi:MAG: glycosyltransferase family 2 protein [Bosea sp. (in: a-proteobacteria)]
MVLLKYPLFALSMTHAINKALENFSQGQWLFALDIIDTVSISDIDAEVALLAVKSYTALGDFDMADRVLERALVSKPLSLALHQGMLRHSVARGHFSAARCQVKSALISGVDAAFLDPVLADALCPDVNALVSSVSTYSELRIDVAARQSGSLRLTLDLGSVRHELTIDCNLFSEKSGAFRFTGSVRLLWPDDVWHVLIGSDHAAVSIAVPTRTRPMFNGVPFGRAPVRPRTLKPVVTVIVPVYRDAGAVRDCLDALAADRSETLTRQIIVINDDSDEPGMASLLARYASMPNFRVETNPVNRGFVGTVNRGLMLAPNGAVCLLNADTVPPRGFLDRLAAYDAPEIGTVTPLSNNGELTSWPTPFVANEMPSPDVAAAIDAAARQLQLPPVNMPNGVGFCLFITEACRNAVGLFNDIDYRLGYLEEVDFCLRAVDAGFHNICAVDVFVPHIGGRSFGSARHGLVSMNHEAVLRRFPSLTRVTDAFLLNDPLAPARKALQRAVLSNAGQPKAHLGGPLRLIISDDLADKELTARVSATGEDDALLLGEGSHGQLVLHRSRLFVPNRFDLPNDAMSEDLPALAQWLDAFAISQVWLDGMSSVSQQLAGLAKVLSVPLVARLSSELAFDDPGMVAILTRADRIVTRAPGLAFRAEATFDRLVVRLPPFYAEPARAFPGLNRAVVLIEQTNSARWLRLLLDLARSCLATNLLWNFAVVGSAWRSQELESTGIIRFLDISDNEFATSELSARRFSAGLVLACPGLHDGREASLLAKFPRPLVTTAPGLAATAGFRENAVIPAEPLAASLIAALEIAGRVDTSVTGNIQEGVGKLDMIRVVA